MSGILEILHDDLQLIKQHLGFAPRAPLAANIATVQTQPLSTVQPYVAPVQQQPLANAVAVPANLTGEQIVAFIQPYIHNEAIKADLGTAMRSMGINALPETQPHQFAQLYSLFQAVIARHTGGTAVTQAPVAPVATSII